MTEAQGKTAPIQKSVCVECPIEDAFYLFTEHFAEWWPLASHSITGDEAETCAIEPWAGGKVFERTRLGEELEWGIVTAWEPPKRVEFTWHPATNHEDDQKVEIKFRTVAYGTEITVTHHGWDAAATHRGWDAAAIEGSTAGPRAMACWLAILDSCFCRFVAEQMLVTA
ncbi:MAG: SRPBCC domain-containing protein [Acidobacteriaceae bacterium]|nr:SRPBCC domain-containing protein [Acidobacteriaceae bacterium]